MKHISSELFLHENNFLYSFEFQVVSKITVKGKTAQAKTKTAQYKMLILKTSAISSTVGKAFIPESSCFSKNSLLIKKGFRYFH